MTEPHQDRRNFQRVVFQQPLTVAQDGQSFPAHLLDISLKGALVQSAQWQPATGETAGIAIELGDEEKLLIEAKVRVAHVNDDHVGLEITSIDLQSVSHLRRLVELNMADPQCLERELEHLVSHPN
jgi:hypothetical protein